MVLLLDVLVKCCPYNSTGHSIYRALHPGGFTKSSSHITPALKANGFATSDVIRDSTMAVTNVKTYSCTGNKTLLPGHSGKNDSHQPQTLQQYNGHLMSQGQTASDTKICNLVRLPASVAKYTSRTSPQESWTMSHQITKPVTSGSQTLLDQLQHHFGTGNVRVT